MTGGAKKMCEDMKINLLGALPLEPKLLLSCENGDAMAEKEPESKSGKMFKQIAALIIK